MKKIKEVIVVEGKDDTKQIAKAVDADTYETNGSAIDAADLSRLADLQKKRGLIVFTDPDYNGERLRKIISQHIPGVKQAFISRQQGVPDKNGGSLGVEHADPQVIRAALEHLYTTVPASDQPLWQCKDLVKAGLVGLTRSRQRRERLGQLLNIGYGNGKQLLKRLNMFQVSRTSFDSAMTTIKKEEARE